MINKKRKPMSEETKRKISLANKGKNSHRKGLTLEQEYGQDRAKEVRKRNSESKKGKISTKKGKTFEEMYGKKHADFMKQEISRRNKGMKPNSTSFKKGRDNNWKGRKHSEQSKMKMSKSSKGSIPWNKDLKGVQICSETTKQKMRLSAIERIEKEEGPMMPCRGKNETQILDNIEIEKNIKIIRQYPIIGYFIDGYDKENNIAYEVDEKFHLNSNTRDIQRQQNIINELGCQFIRIEDY